MNKFNLEAANKQSKVLSFSAPANADGADGLLDLSKSYNNIISEFSCNKGCKKVVYGRTSGWYQV